MQTTIIPDIIHWQIIGGEVRVVVVESPPPCSCGKRHRLQWLCKKAFFHIATILWLNSMWQCFIYQGIWNEESILSYCLPKKNFEMKTLHSKLNS